jgi:hypothetical protein
MRRWPVRQVPTASDRSLGFAVWGGGPTAALVYMKGPWVAGALANNVWSFGGTSGRGGTQYTNFLVRLFVNYNFGEGCYVGSPPIITANWLERGSIACTVPVGALVDRVFSLGKLPVNLSAGGYYSVVLPDDGANWQLRTQVTVIF